MLCCSNNGEGWSDNGGMLLIQLGKLNKCGGYCSNSGDLELTKQDVVPTSGEDCSDNDGKACSDNGEVVS